MSPQSKNQIDLEMAKRLEDSACPWLGSQKARAGSARDSIKLSPILRYGAVPEPARVARELALKKKLIIS